jgi:hypothetical protein
MKLSKWSLFYVWHINSREQNTHFKTEMVAHSLEHALEMFREQYKDLRPLQVTHCMYMGEW